MTTKTMYAKLVAYFCGCGFSSDEAKKEIESIIHYNTTGIDAVSREYAIELMCSDLDLI